MAAAITAHIPAMIRTRVPLPFSSAGTRAPLVVTVGSAIPDVTVVTSDETVVTVSSVLSEDKGASGAIVVTAGAAVIAGALVVSMSAVV